MVDAMRQQPERRRKPSEKQKSRGNDDKEKCNAASSFSKTEDDIACFCCGDRDWLLNRCKKKSTIPKDQWHKPKYWKPEYAKKDRAQNHSQVLDSCKTKNA